MGDLRADFEVAFPQVKALERQAYLLHPTRQAGLDPLASKLGGAIHWPVGQSWPVCEEDGEAYVPVLQIRAGDAPGLPFPRGKDLLQVLWCPRDHEDDGYGNIYVPILEVRWQEAAAPPSPEAIPEPSEPVDDYSPVACSLAFTEVSELPVLKSLEKSLRKEVLRWLKARRADDDDYAAQLGPRMESKLSGHPWWYQDTPQFSDRRGGWHTSPHCQQGHAMNLLLTLATGDGSMYQVAGVSVGRMGACYVFSCAQCGATPIAVVHQN